MLYFYRRLRVPDAVIFDRARPAPAFALAAACAATLIVTAVPSSAQAAPAHPGTVVITTKGIPLEVRLAAKQGVGERGMLTSRPVANSGASAAAAEVINCTASSDWPHVSREMSSTVDGKSKTGCDAIVRDLRAQAELYRYLDGYGFTLVGTGSLAYDFDTAGPKQSVAFDICRGIPQYYYTKGYHSVVFPAGFLPPSGSVQTQSAVVQVSC